MFQDKLVLIGGMFEASRDKYQTPTGEQMYGVQILAITIASEIVDRKLTEASWTIFLVLDVAVGLLLVAGGYFVPKPWRPLVVFAPIAIIGTASLFMFHLFSYYLSTMPLLFGVFVHALLENLRDYRLLKRENSILMPELESLRRLLFSKPV